MVRYCLITKPCLAFVTPLTLHYLCHMERNEPHIRGRFAPSPTGRMHLGNVYCALLSWLAAKSEAGEWILRIEDLDLQRSRLEYAEQIEKDLEWLGLKWDEGGISGGPYNPYYQSQRQEIYDYYFRLLQQRQTVYPCFCTRADILAATQAPHLGEPSFAYPGTCRNLTEEERNWKSLFKQPSYRLKVPDETISFKDGHYGLCQTNLAQTCGDFILRRADGMFAYQLAVVVDDMLMRINQVVRGRDLLTSTPQQIYLYRLFGASVPEFYHVPLLMSPEGARLCKRDKSLHMGEMKKIYSKPEQLLGLIGAMCGIIDRQEEVTANELLQEFSWSKLVKHDINAYFFAKF